MSRKLLVIDSRTAGISGDMLLGALVDLGADVSKLLAALKYVEENFPGCKELRLEFKPVIRGEMKGQKVELEAREESRERTSAELEEAISQISEKLGLSSQAQKLARDTITTLARAEARVHGETPEGVHLAELGSVDTVVDIIAVAIALEDLGFLEETPVYATPVGVGSGLLNFSHGLVPVPPPATLEILREKGFPLIGHPVDHELATPTGVSLLTNLADEVINCYPPMRPVRVGYGAGEAELPQIPNLLRIVAGEPIEGTLLTETIYMLETNVDDVPGEVAGHVVDRALKEGARDCCLIPMFTKKNRPGQIIQIMVEEGKVEKLAQMLFEELGTLGVRSYPCQRYILDREFIPVEVMVGRKREMVVVKMARDKRGKVVQLKPEYEELKRLAERSGRSLREITRLVQRAAWEKLAGESALKQSGHAGQSSPF